MNTLKLGGENERWHCKKKLKFFIWGYSGSSSASNLPPSPSFFLKKTLIKNLVWIWGVEKQIESPTLNNKWNIINMSTKLIFNWDVELVFCHVYTALGKYSYLSTILDRYQLTCTYQCHLCEIDAVVWI